MKKVVFFTARDLSNVGGGERMLSLVANKLCNEYNIEILTPYKSNPHYELNKRVKLNTLGLLFPQNGIKRKFQYIRIIKKLRNWERSNTCDYLIISSSMAFLLTTLVRWSSDMRLYAWMHLSYFHPTHKILKWIEKLSYKKYNIISINSMDMDIYKKYTPSVFHIPNPKPFVSLEKASLSQKRIISVGRFEKGKRFNLLIDLCANVFSNIPEWELHIYGQDDGERNTMEKQIIERGMKDRIKIHNPTVDIKNEYLKSSVFVTTTQIEAFSLVLLEASECGLPCISFDIPSGPRDIVENNYNGYLIKEGDFAAFEEKLESLLLSYNLRKTMGANAAKKAELFDEKYIIQQWKQILR